jgi:UDP-N-acetylenolpyruvoylglucosamine reductase
MGTFDLTTARPVAPSGGFDLSTAKLVQQGQPAGNQSPLDSALSTLKRIGSGYMNYVDTSVNHPIGSAENGLHLASGAIGGLAGGLTYLGGLAATGGDSDRAKAAQEQVQSALTYTPRTDAGKQLAGAIDGAMSVVPKAGNAAGSFIADKTGSPLLGALANTTVNAVPMFLGLRRGLGATADAANASAAAADAAASAAKRAPTTPAELMAQSLNNGKNVGYQVTPSFDPGATFADTAAQGIAGKANLEQGARVQNQPITSALGARAVGLPPASLVTQTALQQLRQAAIDKGYAPIEQLDGPITADAQFLKNNQAIKSAHGDELSGNPDVTSAADILNKGKFDPAKITDQISTLRARAQDAYAAGRPSAGSAFKQQAGELEALIDRHLQDLDNAPPDILKNYRAARQLIAKTYVIGDNLNPSTGAIDAAGIGAKLKNGTPLDGDLKIIADFANAAPELTRVPHGAPLPTSPLNTAAGIATAHATGGASLALIPAARMAAAKWLIKRNDNPALLQPIGKSFGNAALDALHGNAKAFNTMYGSIAPGVDLSTADNQ